MKSLRKKLNKKGFTLVELVVVIAIIGILAAFAVPKFLGFQEDARKNADIATGKQVADITSVLVSQGKIDSAVTSITIAADGTAGSDTNAQLILDKVQNTVKLNSVNGTGKVITITLDTNRNIKVYAGTAGTPTTNVLYPTPGSDFK